MPLLHRPQHLDPRPFRDPELLVVALAEVLQAGEVHLVLGPRLLVLEHLGQPLNLRVVDILRSDVRLRQDDKEWDLKLECNQDMLLRHLRNLLVGSDYNHTIVREH